jgi:hypothetical protein
MEPTMRYVPFLVAVSGLTLVLLRSISFDAPERKDPRRIPTYSWGEMHDIFTLENDLDERVRRMQLFRQVLLDTEQDLLNETRPLNEAADAVHSAAQKNNPAFLRDLEERYSGMTVREQVALTLVLRLTLIQSEGNLSAEQERAVDSLRCELTGWVDSSDALREHVGSVLR